MTSKVMVSAAHVADRDGLTKQAVTKAVRAMADAGELEVERDTRGRIVKFALAQFDHVREKYLDPNKSHPTEKAPQPAAPIKDLSSLDEARRQSEWLKVDRERIRQQEMAGQLVRVDKLQSSLKTIGNQIQRSVARLPNRADDLALAVTKEGISGLRAALIKVANEINSSIADAMAEIKVAAPTEDQRLEETDA